MNHIFWTLNSINAGYLLPFLFSRVSVRPKNSSLVSGNRQGEKYFISPARKVDYVSEYIFLIKKQQQQEDKKQKKIKNGRELPVENLTGYTMISFLNLICVFFN